MAEQVDPLVSVILPIRNEEAFIERCLGAVLAQDYPAERMEILIADGMSEDRTLAVIASMRGAERVRIIPNARRIQSAGLNEAIKEAHGEIILRVDGHTIIAEDYVRQCVDALQSIGASNVGGAMDPVGLTWMGRAIAAAGKSPFAVPTAFHVSQKPQMTDTVYMGAWPKRVFDQVGGYNEALVANEDYELNYRIRKAGGTIYFTPAIRSVYYGRQSLRALAIQYFRYGRYKLRMLRQHPRSVKLRHLAAPALIAAVVLGGVGALVSPLIGWAWLAILLLYGLANGVASLHTAWRRGGSLLPALPLVFATIHFAWGLGFWAEIIKPQSN